MVPERSAFLTRLTLEALERAGQRGIIMSGWGGLSSASLPRNVFSMDFAPHDWLFPQMAAIVHHGGSGTTAETLRSGVPSIVVSFWIEQRYWGRKIANLGVGPAPISYGGLTSEKLAGKISTVLASQGMRQRATALAQKIRSEDGIGRGVAVVNNYLSKR
jgi:UDP:flavonoid glycosyltransferase YjiC (YdhE family)